MAVFFFFPFFFCIRTCIRDCNFNEARVGGDGTRVTGTMEQLSTFKDSPPSGHVLHASERSFFITTCHRIKHGEGRELSSFPLPPRHHVPFDLFTWGEAVLLVSPLLRGIRRDNRVIRVDRLINKSASIRSTISRKVKVEEARANFRPRIYIFFSIRDRETKRKRM